MALDINSILNAVVSHALSLGYFDAVNTFESKKSPSSGLTVGIWVERVTPVRTSGLDNASLLITLTVRIYSDSLNQPYDSIDPNLTIAMDALMAAYAGDFTLGGLIRHVDLFGSAGVALQSRSGWINMDGKEFRVFSVTLPLIVNDIWTEAP